MLRAACCIPHPPPLSPALQPPPQQQIHQQQTTATKQQQPQSSKFVAYLDGGGRGLLNALQRAAALAQQHRGAAQAGEHVGCGMRKGVGREQQARRQGCVGAGGMGGGARERGAARGEGRRDNAAGLAWEGRTRIGHQPLLTAYNDDTGRRSVSGGGRRLPHMREAHAPYVQFAALRKPLEVGPAAEALTV